MNALQKYVLIPTAVSIIGSNAVAFDISEKVINEFLKNKAGIDQLWEANLNCSGKFYTFSVVSKNENYYGRPHAQATETATDVANILNFVNQGLPLEEQINNSKDVLSGYLRRELGCIDRCLIQPIYGPDSTIVQFNYRGDISKYRNRLKLGEDPIVDSKGKIRIFNDEFGIEKVEEPRWGWLGVILGPKTEYKTFTRKDPIKHSLHIPYKDIVLLYERSIRDSEVQEILRHNENLKQIYGDKFKEISEDVKDLSKEIRALEGIEPKKIEKTVRDTVTLKEPIEFGLFASCSNNEWVYGISFPLIRPVRFNIGIMLPYEKQDNLTPEYTTEEFLSGNIAHHEVIGREKTNLVDCMLSYPINIGRFGLEPGIGVSVVRKKTDKTIVDKIVSPNGYTLDQDVDKRVNDITKGRFRGNLGLNYRTNNLTLGLNLGCRGDRPVFGVSTRLKIPQKGRSKK